MADAMFESSPSDPVFAVLGIGQGNAVSMDPQDLRAAIASAPALPSWDHWASCGDVMHPSVFSPLMSPSLSPYSVDFAGQSLLPPLLQYEQQERELQELQEMHEQQRMQLHLQQKQEQHQLRQQQLQQQHQLPPEQTEQKEELEEVEGKNDEEQEQEPNLSLKSGPLTSRRMQILPDCLPAPSSHEVTQSTLGIFKENLSGDTEVTKLPSAIFGEKDTILPRAAGLRELTNTLESRADDGDAIKKPSTKSLRPDAPVFVLSPDAQVFVPEGTVIVEDYGSLPAPQEDSQTPSSERVKVELPDEATTSTVTAAADITVLSPSRTTAEGTCLSPFALLAEGPMSWMAPPSAVPPSAAVRTPPATTSDRGPAELLLRRLSRELLLQFRPPVSPRAGGLCTLNLHLGSDSPSRRPTTAGVGTGTWVRAAARGAPELGSQAEQSWNPIGNNLVRSGFHIDEEQGVDAHGVASEKSRRRRRRPRAKENEPNVAVEATGSSIDYR